MKNSLPIEPSLRLVLSLLKKDIFSTLNCHAIGKIEAFNGTKQTATVSVAYSQTSVNDNAAKKDYPLMLECPVIVMGGGNGSLRFPITSGDFCVILFNDRDIDNFILNGSKAILASDRKHSFADAIALVGLHPLNKSLPAYSSSRTELIHDQTKVSLAAKIKIENAAKNLYTVLGKLIDDLVALQTTNAVPGAPCALSPATISNLNADKADLGALLE